MRGDAGDLEILPDFEETHYIPIAEADAQASSVTGASPPLYWYPPFGYNWWAGGGGPNRYVYSPIPPYVSETERNIPDGVVALKEGAKVLSVDGDHVGDVEAVLTDAKTDRATHLLISRGFLLKETKLIPTTWISTVMEDQIHLLVGSVLLQDLPVYEPPA